MRAKIIFTTCEECGRRLTDPKSIEAGMGPKCRANKLQRDIAAYRKEATE